MNIETVHNLEQGVIKILNLDGWDLDWCGGKFEHYDAVGETPKGRQCIIEMKFRKKYYETKILEKYKYEKLMDMPADMIKIYFVADPKGNYFFWLNNIELSPIKELYCPSTTLWHGAKKNKEVYLLEESQAAIVNLL
jgi:hypothetical protein